MKREHIPEGQGGAVCGIQSRGVTIPGVRTLHESSVEGSRVCVQCCLAKLLTQAWRGPDSSGCERATAD